MVMTIPYIAEEMAVATDKTRYKDVKVRIPEEELAVLNCRVAKTGMSREQYIRCLIADTIPAEYGASASPPCPRRVCGFAFENRKRPTSPETVRFRGDFGRFCLI